MEHVLVVNTTDIDQTVIDIANNEARIVSPGAGCIIDKYTKDHSYLYKSYARKGLDVQIVDDSFFDNVKLDPPVDLEKVDITDKPPVAESIEEVTETITEDTDKQPKKRSRKSSKNSSEISEEVSATSESGE